VQEGVAVHPLVERVSDLCGYLETEVEKVDGVDQDTRRAVHDLCPDLLASVAALVDLGRRLEPRQLLDMASKAIVVLLLLQVNARKALPVSGELFRSIKDSILNLVVEELDSRYLWGRCKCEEDALPHRTDEG